MKKSGIQLCRLFQRIYTPRKCYWVGCPVCKYSNAKKSCKCRVSNIVYEARCIKCVDQVTERLIREHEVGVYIGETSRTLMERATEHVIGAEHIDLDNFITKHWANKHKWLSEAPRMRFNPISRGIFNNLFDVGGG